LDANTFPTAPNLGFASSKEVPQKLNSMHGLLSQGFKEIISIELRIFAALKMDLYE
jgi:hypothetical protein